MLAFPSLISQAAIDVGIKVPPDDVIDEIHHTRKHGDMPAWSPDDYPHFHLFCCAQLGRPMSPGAHWDNAKVIAAIPEDKLRTITPAQLEERGWHF